MKKPPIGTPIFIVSEHLYYILKNPAPLREYIVLPAMIESYFRGGYTEICTKAQVPEKGTVPMRFKLSMLDKGYVFLTAKGAALFAKELTEKEESSVLFQIGKDPPMRRTWEKYLT